MHSTRQLLLIATTLLVVVNGQYGQYNQTELGQTGRSLSRLVDVIPAYVIWDMDVSVLTNATTGVNSTAPANMAVFFPTVDRFSQLTIPGSTYKLHEFWIFWILYYGIWEINWKFSWKTIFG